jgi:hypothetical protein
MRHGARYPDNRKSIKKANEILYNLKNSIAGSKFIFIHHFRDLKIFKTKLKKKSPRYLMRIRKQSDNGRLE